MMMLFIKYAAIGFGGGFLLIVVSKIILAAILQREPDYYDDQYDQFDQGGESDV